jgi:hypothetical protein
LHEVLDVGFTPVNGYYTIPTNFFTLLSYINSDAAIESFWGFGRQSDSLTNVASTSNNLIYGRSLLPSAMQRF